MSLLAETLQPHTVNGLMSLAGRAASVTISDLITPRAAGYDLDFDNSTHGILIDYRDSKYVLEAIAGDCCRLGMAAFQSARSISADLQDNENVAWSAIKAYYAAFYAGHALIRLTGQSCSYFDSSHASTLRTLADASGRTPPFTIESGLYQCIISPQATALRCVKLRGSNGGSHESFWRIFQDHTRSLMEQILIVHPIATEAQAVFYQLDLLNGTIAHLGLRSHSGLTEVRNAVQYRHKFGAWFPARLKRRDLTVLSRIATQWQSDPMEIDLSRRQDEPIRLLIAACMFIVSLCRSLLLRMAERSTVGTRSFICRGPLAYLNAQEAA